MEYKTNPPVPQVLLLGNGLNQIDGGLSWSNFLRSIATKEEIADGTIDIDKLKCPEPLKAILVTEDHIDTAMREACKEMQSFIPSGNARNLYQKILALGLDDILTTNYTYELEYTALDSEKANEKSITKMMRHTDEVSRADCKYLLHTYNMVVQNKCVNKVWHIHGEARKPASTILGHYYYGKLLYRIIEKIEKRNYSEKRDSTSWIDSFILGDIYILGFGFAFSEIDLWWLLNRKAREKTNIGKVYFYDFRPAKFDEKVVLLQLMKKTFGGDPLVEFVDCGYKKKLVQKDGKETTELEGEYKDFYNDAIDDIANKLSEKREKGLCPNL